MARTADAVQCDSCGIIISGSDQRKSIVVSGAELCDTCAHTLQSRGYLHITEGVWLLKTGEVFRCVGKIGLAERQASWIRHNGVADPWYFQRRHDLD